jgi:hypothetical protein
MRNPLPPIVTLPVAAQASAPSEPPGCEAELGRATENARRNDSTFEVTMVGRVSSHSRP